MQLFLKFPHLSAATLNPWPAGCGLALPWVGRCLPGNDENRFTKYPCRRYEEMNSNMPKVRNMEYRSILSGVFELANSGMVQL